METLPRPWIEVGVGSGRFASDLGVEIGLDPASDPLNLATRRGTRVVRGRVETLPFAAGTFGGMLLIVTICFVADPLAALREARRVVGPRGWSCRSCARPGPVTNQKPTRPHVVLLEGGTECFVRAYAREARPHPCVSESWSKSFQQATSGLKLRRSARLHATAASPRSCAMRKSS